jgi:hypothetical protein
MEDVRTIEQAEAALETDIRSFTPAALQKILDRFPALRPKALCLFSGKSEEHEKGIKVIVRSISQSDLLSVIEHLDPEILVSAVRIRPSLAAAVLKERGERKGYSADLLRRISEAVAKSSAPRIRKDRIAWEIITTDGQNSGFAASAFPHLRFRIMKKYPCSILTIARNFPKDARKIALLYPRYRKMIAEMYPDKKEEIRRHFPLEQ